MTRTHNRRGIRGRVVVAVIGVLAVALAVAACGGASGGGYGGSSSSATKSSPAKGSSVGLASTGLGKILVDGKGRTLYLFEADKGKSSMCDGACASLWPPLTTTGKPTAGAGISAAKLGTTKRADGTTEVTYNGHPLYTYAADQAPGQTTGQGIDSFGAEWYVLSAAGKTVEREA
jgi:predicted lipoprotein with Yx(FWY)xxD motif